MVCLNSIGRMEYDNPNMRIILEKQYRKALKHLNEFSHIHIAYTYKEQDIWRLNTKIGKIQSVDRKTGAVYLEDWGGEFAEFDVMDIKPYFPCEDSVKEADEKTPVSHSGFELIKTNSDDSYEMEPAGSIRNTHGEIYIQLSQMPEISGRYAKIFWWFDKFDSDLYRRLTECNPPYENAPKTGIFATRSPVRPNPLAVTVAKITKVDRQQKRIYINAIESFDKTPCLGIREYCKYTDFVSECKVPEWLSHWPKWYDDKESDKNSGTVQCRDSALKTLLNVSSELPGEEKTSPEEPRGAVWNI